MKLSNSALVSAAVTGMFAGGLLVGCPPTASNNAGANQTNGDANNTTAKKPWEMGLEKHACKGMNSCEGKGGCAVEGKHDCAGKNACEGKGGCPTVEHHTCAGQNSCTGLGGCAVEGKHDCAGKNDCNGKGGCHVPVQHDG